jgi:hypothetical protein
MLAAQILWHEESQKYHLNFNGKTLVKSGKLDYLEYLVRDQANQKVRMHNITKVEIVSRKPADGPSIELATDDVGPIIVAQRPTFTINERFEMLADLIKMVINKNARSILITGEGGVGKTHTVLGELAAAGKIDTKKAPKPVAAKIAEVALADGDDEEEEEGSEARFDTRDTALMERFEPGDYVVMKGYTSAAGMYEFLYTYRDKIIIFDDCDSVLKDGTASLMLKAALDTYEERWVTWNTSSAAVNRSSAPSSFLFTGSIIFISNMNIRKVDEAVRTRCHKVDVSMTNAQRIERMRHVIADVMPGVENDLKLDALNLLDEYKDLTSNINFRSWMNIISIRKDPSVSDWKRLALFSLLDSH